MSKHTPGPWVNKNGEPTFIPLRSHHCEKLGFSVGFVSWDDDDGRGEPLANARLIAASPELLEALISIAEESPDKGAQQCAIEAIAKATGEQS